SCGCRREAMGGPYITIYTKPYGHEVPGLVYAEASHPDQKERFEAALGKPLEGPGTAVFGRADSRPRQQRSRDPCRLAADRWIRPPSRQPPLSEFARLQALGQLRSGSRSSSAKRSHTC